jgi:hypothetical protein
MRRSVVQVLSPAPYLVYCSVRYSALDQIFIILLLNGGIGEWSNPADCKSAASGFEGSNPSPTTICYDAGVAQLARASAFQADCRRFESGLPLHDVNIDYWEQGYNK